MAYNTMSWQYCDGSGQALLPLHMERGILEPMEAEAPNDELSTHLPILGALRCEAAPDSWMRSEEAW